MPGDSRRTPATDRRPNCSLSSPDPVPPSCATASREPLELKSASPPSDRSATSGGNGLSKSGGGGGGGAHFTEIEDATVASETEEGAHSSGGGSGAAPRAQQQQAQQQQQHQDPNATSSTPTSNDCQSPQIFPWMRKLHISHDMTGPDGKRARTAYTRYQTLELEKEFHFNSRTLLENMTSVKVAGQAFNVGIVQHVIYLLFTALPVVEEEF
ncbi:hypothetical protein L3Q82_010555 [Scortum barcoo]|uniref:Uncharacterized protein n=1 Tax=Scortum barcoo TaxID=214431 RepID=A0ACB8WCE4_9TELE|nr:hypothetical protein L3Q82_010555 [Scortum barcoo]